MSKAKQYADSGHVSQVNRKPFFTNKASEGVRTGSFFGPSIQTKLTVGASDDHYEREADNVADRVVNGEHFQQSSFFNSGDTVSPKFLHRKPANTKTAEEEVQTKADAKIQRSGLLEESQSEIQQKPFIQRSSETTATVAPASFESGLNTTKGNGSPLPAHVKSGMESGIGADFSNLKIHTGPQASALSNQIGAKAFAHGNDIYFNEGQYEPESTDGQHLLAHELTHTVQQGESVQTKPQIAATKPKVQRIADWILEELNDYARYIPGWTLFTVIIGSNPLLRRSVSRSANNLVQGLIELIPGAGPFVYDKLSELGIIQDAFNWVEGQLSELDLSLDRLERTIDRAWDEVSIVRGLDYNIGVLERTFGRLYNDVVTFASRVGDKIISLIKEALISFLKSFVEDIPGYTLLTKILGKDPLTDEPVEATTAEIISDFLTLIGAERELQKMQEEGTLQETADWIDEQLAILNFSFEELKNLFTQTWDTFSFSDVADPVGAYNRVAAIWSPFFTRVSTFAINVATQVVEFVKNALLSKLREFALETRGYHLLTVLLGKDPFTGQVVPRSVENIIRGFMSLMDGGEQQFQEMKASGAIARTTGRINAAVTELGFTWSYITGLFMSLWNSFSIDDIFHPIDAFTRIIDTISAPIGRLFVFIVKIVRIVIEVLLEVMNFPTNLIGQIISKVQAAWEQIKSKPIDFIKNLLRGVKRGFQQFFDNIGTHLLNGLTGWLFGELAEAGITPPPDLSLGSILQLVMQVLGITVEKIWEKLGEHIGPERVERIRGMIDRLTGIWTFVSDVIRDGPAAIWQHVSSFLSNLWDMVFNAVRNWVMERIIGAVVTKLMSMLDPTGVMAVINSFIAIYNAIQSFIQYFRQMLEMINRFVDGVLAIAQGNIQPAADKVEQSLGSAMPIAIGFLANQVGLGGIGRRIGEMIQVVQTKVDEALDWLIGRALSIGSGVLNSLGMGGSGEGTETTDEPDQRSESEVEGLGPLAGIQEPFDEMDGDHHTLRFAERGGIKLMVYSDPKDVFEYLQSDELDQTDPRVRDANMLANEIRTMTSGPISDEDSRAINSKLRELTEILGDIRGGSTFLPTQPVYNFTTENGKAKTAEAELLSASRAGGSTPGNAYVKGWNAITQGLTTGGGHWKRMHLINQNFGGLGITENLVPGTASQNSQTESNFDGPLKNNYIGRRPNDSSGPQKVIWIRVTVTYYSGDFDQDLEVPLGISGDELDGQERVTKGNYASNISFRAGEYEYSRSGRNWERTTNEVASDDISGMDLPDWSRVTTPVLSSASPSELRRAYVRAGGVTDNQAASIFTTYIVSLLRSSNIDGPSSVEPVLNEMIETPGRRDTTKAVLRQLKIILPVMENSNNLAY